MTDRYFTEASFDFLRALAANNSREWFASRKQDYESTVRAPALRFIADIADGLAEISPHFLAIPRAVGGSLMRVHRDTRFGGDKRPYKTNVGIQFRHALGKDVHAPGFYVHVEPDECFLGVGSWKPDAVALGKIRDAIVARGDAWCAASGDRSFRKRFELVGDALRQAPRGFAKDHPLLEDLKRKDFIAVRTVDDAYMRSPRLPGEVLDSLAKAVPFMQFLCRALDLRF